MNIATTITFLGLVAMINCRTQLLNKHFCGTPRLDCSVKPIRDWCQVRGMCFLGLEDFERFMESRKSHRSESDVEIVEITKSSQSVEDVKIVKIADPVTPKINKPRTTLRFRFYARSDLMVDVNERYTTYNSQEV